VSTVYKYPIALDQLNQDEFSIPMPKGSLPLSFQVQRGIPTLWAEVNDESPSVNHRFILKGTGQGLGLFSGMPFIGTIQLNDGLLVLHLFDGGEL
jgi:hypothetical protein